MVGEGADTGFLSWDRFVRLKAAADYVQQKRKPGDCLLDVGGYDGALALFLDGLTVDLLDPDTTDGCVTQIQAEDDSYDFVVAIDVLEHIPPDLRSLALRECARVARTHLVINYPCQASRPAQDLVLKLTNNRLVREHVEWPLPDSYWVMSALAKAGFRCDLKEHANVGIWVGQYLMHCLLPDKAVELNRFLIDHHVADRFETPLYHLVTASRSSSP